MDYDDDAALDNEQVMEMDDEEQPNDEDMVDVEDLPVTQEDSWAVIRYDRWPGAVKLCCYNVFCG